MTKDTLTHKHLELVRRLESQSFIFATDPKVATATAQKQTGTPFEKLVTRAKLIDSDNKLQLALKKGNFLFKTATKLYSGLYFILGFVGVFGLLNTQIVSFFYVLIGLLGWHSLTLLLWLIGLRKQTSYSAIYLLLDKLSPKNTAEKHAFDIYLNEFKQQDTWRIGLIIHRAWLFGLLGSLLALLLLFLFKRYGFIWESTLLLDSHFERMLDILATVPSFIGIKAPHSIYPLTQNIATELAILIMTSVIIYGMLPRFLAYLYCLFKAKATFSIDKNLFYYQNLLKQFNTQIIDADDFLADEIRVPTKAQVSTGIKVVGTLEYHADNDWYHAGAGTYIKDAGRIDDHDDISHTIALANNNQAQLYLGVSPKLLPDRGVLRKFDTLLHGVHYGVVVEFIGDGDHLQAWQQALVARGVSQVQH